MEGDGGGARGRDLGRFRAAAEFAPEAFHSSGGIHEFLLSGVERVAVGADFHLEGVLLQSCADGKGIPARAGSRNAPVRGMCVAFHCGGWRVVELEGLGVVGVVGVVGVDYSTKWRLGQKNSDFASIQSQSRANPEPVGP